MDKDLVDKKAFALVSSSIQYYKLTSQRLNDREKNIKEVAKSRREEIQGLFSNRTFEVVEEDNIGVRTRTYGSRIVGIIKAIYVRT